jgi:hypothetical protein
MVEFVDAGHECPLRDHSQYDYSTGHGDYIDPLGPRHQVAVGPRTRKRSSDLLQIVGRLVYAGSEGRLPRRMRIIVIALVQ